MSHESFARMVEYYKLTNPQDSHKMIDTIAKEVEDHFVGRSEYKTLEFKYMMAEEKIEHLQKELKLLKETQPGFKTCISTSNRSPSDISEASI